MAGSSLMSLGTRAMFANYAALQTTGNNISNANTAGYSRQQVELQTVAGQGSGAGYFGRGVDVATVTRAHDEFLTREAAVSKSIAAADSSRLGQLKQLEKVFQTGEAGLGHATGQLLNAFADVASKPSDGAARQVVLARSEELASRFRTASEQVSTLQAGVVQEVKGGVAAVNDLARQVAAINGQIAATRGSSHTPNDLLDKRDQLVSEISQYVSVSSVSAPDGSQNLFIGGGQVLVLGANAMKLQAMKDPFDAEKVRVGITDADGSRMLESDTLTSGALAGLISFQDADLTDARNLIGQMATALSGALNQQQALGLDLGNPPASGAAILSVGQPRALAASTNTGNATLSVQVGTASEVQASDYAVRFDGTDYSIVRSSDGRAVNGSPFSAADLSAGVSVDGMNIRLTGGAAATGDRFVLQPVALAAASMQRMLTNPKGIAAAAPVTATVPTDNRGTAGIGALRMTSSPTNPALTPTQSLSLRFTSATAYEVSLVDSNTNPATTSVLGTGTWTPGQPIRIADTAPLSGFEIDLTGVPRGPETVNGQARPGDAIVIAPTRYPESNNTNALAMGGLNTRLIVGQQTLPDGTVVPGVSVTDAYAGAMATIGLRVQTAQSASSMSASVATNAEAERANKAGVNLDEEAARLMQFQQSYQAAAKMLQTAQTVFDILLDVTRG